MLKTPNIKVNIKPTNVVDIKTSMKISKKNHFNARLPAFILKVINPQMHGVKIRGKTQNMINVFPLSICSFNNLTLSSGTNESTLTLP